MKSFTLDVYAPEFGEVLETYRLRWFGQFSKIALCFIMLAAAAGLIAIYFSFPVTTEQECENTRAEVPGLLYCAGGIAIFGLTCLIWWWFSRGIELQIKEHGFIYKTHSQVSICRWDEIEDIARVDWPMTKHQQAHPAVVVCTDGRRIKPNWELYDLHKNKIEVAILEKWKQAIYPGILRSYEQGQDVYFGEVTLSKRGIGFLDNFMNWDDYRGMAFRLGMILFWNKHDSKPVFYIPLGAIQRLPLFGQLWDHIMAENHLLEDSDSSE